MVVVTAGWLAATLLACGGSEPGERGSTQVAATATANRFDGTALIPAAERAHLPVIRELLATDIDVDHVNRLGWTALLEAIILSQGGPEHTEVVRLMVGAGADIDLPDSSGVTPLAHARQRGYTGIASLLEQAGAR